MPDLSGTGLNTRRPYSASFTDFRGRSRASLVNGGDESTTVQATALRTAMGNASNARITSTRETVLQEQINLSAAQNFTHDEAYPSVSDALIIIFQDAGGLKETVVIPAPDALLFQPDGETPVAPDAAGSAGQVLMQAIHTAALAYLNADTPAGTFAFSRAYLEGAGVRARSTMPIQEPGAQAPGAGPGV